MSTCFSERIELLASRKCLTHTVNQEICFFTVVQQKDDLETAPVLGVNDDDYKDASMYEDKLFPWFETIKGEDCKVNYSACSTQVNLEAMVFKFTCPEVCKKDTYHRFFVLDVLQGQNVVSRIGDAPSLPGSDKLCSRKMKQIFVNSGQNTKVILENAGFTSDLEDMEVITGEFLELKSGTQYCMQVKDAGKEAAISVYKFKKENTTSFIVSLPFENIPACTYFLKKVACQWAAKNKCSYAL